MQTLWIYAVLLFDELKTDHNYIVRFEVFTAVIMKNGVFWVGSYKSHTA
jgi:hypothetical protein